MAPDSSDDFRRRAAVEGKFRRMLSGRSVPSQLKRADALERIDLHEYLSARATVLPVPPPANRDRKGKNL